MESIQGEAQQLFPHFWLNTEALLWRHLAELGADNEAAQTIVSDLMPRCAGIEPILPSNPNSVVHRHFAALMVDAITAEQRLFAATHSRAAGTLLGDWPPTPIAGFDHPFLIAFGKVVSQIEVEANKAEGGRRLN